MGVVRIDDELEKEIELILKKAENKYRFPSKTTFLNILIHEHLLELKRKKQGKKRSQFFFLGLFFPCTVS